MRPFSERLGKEILVFDGAYGTSLRDECERYGVRTDALSAVNPESVTALHLRYIESGADIIKTNTFGANAFNYPDGETLTVEDVVSASVNAAREAVVRSGKETYIALDIGPTGKLVGIGGELSFESAVEVFSRTVRAGASGCDLVLIETFGNLSETRAALLAAKENSDLPVIVTNVYGEDGRTFTGSSVDAICTTLEGMRADAVGMNCSIGPEKMAELLPEFLKNTSLPIVVNPNAGLPETDSQGRTYYSITPEEYAAYMTEMAKAGAAVLGGCCGTTPEFIGVLKRSLEGLDIVKREVTPSVKVASASSSRVISVDGDFTVIGERINPTGKAKLKTALRENDVDYILGEAHRQISAGAHILDVNVGIPEIDEAEVLSRVIRELQNVTDLPLQIDTSSHEAMEKALRQYNGKALINSVNGSQISMDSILPLAAKYGGVLVALTLDEKGIPDTPEERFEIAVKIINEAKKYGIKASDIIFDPLTLTLGADPDAAKKTLGAVRLITEKLGIPCTLGVSNVSFGLPDRETINCRFLSEAKAAGLAAAIMNPCSEAMMAVASGICKDVTGDVMIAPSTSRREVDLDDLSDCVRCGMKQKSAELAARKCITEQPENVISAYIIPALESIGKDFETGKAFLPELLAAADAAISALNVVTERIPRSSDGNVSSGKVVLATVQGDVHDIGKNIVGVMLRSYGFDVIDLGKDVPPEKIVRTAEESGAAIVGLSALMTTTLPSMAKTILALHEKVPSVKIVVGGAVLTEEYAGMIGADKYASDAMATVRFAREIYGS